MGRNETEIVNIIRYWGTFTYLTSLIGRNKESMALTNDLTMMWLDTPKNESDVKWSQGAIAGNPGGYRRWLLVEKATEANPCTLRGPLPLEPFQKPGGPGIPPNTGFKFIFTHARDAFRIVDDTNDRAPKMIITNMKLWVRRAIPHSLIITRLLMKIKQPTPLRMESVMTVILKDQELDGSTEQWDINCGENIRRPSTVYVLLMSDARSPQRAMYAMNPMVFKPWNLRSVQISYGANDRFPQLPITFEPATQLPTQYQELYTRIRECWGMTSTLNAQNCIDFDRYWRNAFVVGIDTSVYGTDIFSVAPIDENLTVGGSSGALKCALQKRFLQL